ncbi:MAG: hypothetical protein ACNS62_02065 [Candidatus Cyclobacteriaceae bacterium M3_2C_046]
MKKIQYFIHLLLILAIVLLVSQCTTEEITPVDIFEPEDPEEILNEGQDQALPIEDICNGNRLFVNQDRLNIHDLGYKIKGTIFSDSDLGPIAVTNGEFDLIRDSEGKITSFQGYGTAQLPKAGFLNDALVMADIFGAQTRYASEALFNEEQGGNLRLPFNQNSCFFQFTLDPYPDFGQDEVGGLAMIKNTMLDYNQLYYDPADPAIFFDGQMVQVKGKVTPQASSKNGEPKRYRSKKSSIKYALEDIRVGLSAGERFEFRPLTFSQELEQTVGGTNFQSFGAGLYMSGKISLIKYPLFVEGENLVTSPEGILNVFENGFDEGYYHRGFNGKIYFGHKLLNFLPLDLEIELARGTLQERVTAQESFLRFAGEYEMDTKDFLTRVIGANAASYFPSLSRNGQMYVNIGTALTDWEYYMMNQFQLDIAGLTTATLSRQYFHFTPDRFAMGTMMELPFGLGLAELNGELNSDGSFLLEGNVEGNIPFGNDVALTGNLNLTVSNQGAFVEGAIRLPGSLAALAVKGQITDEGILLEGEGEVRIKFADEATLLAYLKVKASTREGVFVEGLLDTPLQVAKVVVKGEVSGRGMMLEGLIKGKLDFGVTKLQSDLSLKASTWGGARLSGMIDVPLVIIGGNISVSGEILSPTRFKLTGSTSAFLDFKVASTTAKVHFGFSQSEIDIGASAEFCLDPIGCESFGILFNPNWGTGKVKICVDFPDPVGEKCI